jgi:hypothetical protein
MLTISDLYERNGKYKILISDIYGMNCNKQEAMNNIDRLLEKYDFTMDILLDFFNYDYYTIFYTSTDIRRYMDVLLYLDFDIDIIENFIIYIIDYYILQRHELLDVLYTYDIILNKLDNYLETIYNNLINDCVFDPSSYNISTILYLSKYINIKHLCINNNLQIHTYDLIKFTNVLHLSVNNKISEYDIMHLNKLKSINLYQNTQITLPFLNKFKHIETISYTSPVHPSILESTKIKKIVKSEDMKLDIDHIYTLFTDHF